MDQNEVRVQDYLDDRLQTAADLESVDSLLDNVRKQQSLLKKQLQEAKDESDHARTESEQHGNDLRRKAIAFQRQQTDIDRTLMIVTQSDSVDDAVTRFQDVMATLHRLEVATAYVELIALADELAAGICSVVGTDIEAAIGQYRQLGDLAEHLTTLQEAAEGAAPHMVDHIQRLTDRSCATILKALSNDFDPILKQVGWPKSDASIPSSASDAWLRVIRFLLQLQQPDLLRAVHHNAGKVSKDEPQVLYVMELLVRPLALRFQYHFSGDRMTNRLDKPEYFLNHAFDLIDEYASFVQSSVQGPLIKLYGQGDLSLTPAYVDAVSAWINALMPLLQRKLQNTLPQIVKQSSLFSNLIHEVMAFDQKLLSEWQYAPLSATTPFRGLSHYVLSIKGYFPAWFAVERDFALARYETIISDRSTGYLDYEGVDVNTTKPTKAAIRVNDLLETITDRYRSLASFHQKMKFLIDIQIALFDKFHQRLQEGLEAYLTRTSTVGRTVHGVGQNDVTDLSGTKGLDRLCRVYGSAEYLEKAMKDWSEDVFFLELWEELQYRSQNPGQLKGDLSMSEIASRTNTSNGRDQSAEDVHGALFDETATSYHRLRTRSETVMVDTIVYDLRGALRPYARVNTWASMSSTGGATSQTAELDAFARMLDEYLAFLARALGKIALRRIVRKVSQSVQDFIWDSVVIRHTFTTAGASQLHSDMKGIWQIIDQHAGARQGITSMRKLVEGLGLLALPVKGEIPIDLVGEDTAKGSSEPVSLGLWEVERRLFANNESAREMLEDLGLESLSESEARDVLKRRVELSS